MITSAVPTQYQNVTSANNSVFSNVIKFFTSLNPRDVPPHLQQKGQAVDYPEFTLTSGGSGHIFTAAMNLLPLATATLCPLELQHVAKFFCNSYSIFQMFSSGSKEKTSEIPSTEKKQNLDKKDECRKITTASYQKTKTITNGDMLLLALSGLICSIPRSQAAPTPNTTPTSDTTEKTSAHDKTIEISTIEKLQKIGNDPAFPLNGSYELIANINGEKLTPIGHSHPFVGSFDGNSHHIDHTKHCIFSFIGNGGEVKNLISEHAKVDITYQHADGGIIACRQNKGGTIDSVLVNNASIINNKIAQPVGLIVGMNYGHIGKAHVSNSSIMSYTSNSYLGAGAGVNEGKIIEFRVDNSKIGSMLGHPRSGSVTGLNTDTGLIDNAYAANNELSDQNNNYGRGTIGGIAGTNEGTIKNSYSLGNTISTSHASLGVGGIVGLDQGNTSDTLEIGNVINGVVVGQTSNVLLKKLIEKLIGQPDRQLTKKITERLNKQTSEQCAEKTTNQPPSTFESAPIVVCIVLGVGLIIAVIMLIRYLCKRNETQPNSTSEEYELIQRPN